MTITLIILAIALVVATLILRSDRRADHFEEVTYGEEAHEEITVDDGPVPHTEEVTQRTTGEEVSS